MTSIDSPMISVSEKSLIETIPDELNPDPMLLLQDSEMTEQLKFWLSQLNEKQRAVITHRFGLEGGEETTLENIGKKMGLTRERVRQIQISDKKVSLNRCFDVRKFRKPQEHYLKSKNS